MAAIENLLKKLDDQINTLLSSWNIYTTFLTLIFLAYLAYPLLFSQDPDVHPFLLARQASASHVRQPGESAIYRSLEAPHGYPLRGGLNVKDDGAPKWIIGRDGDIRDVWKQALRGALGSEGNPTGQRGHILSVMGKEETIEHDLRDLTKEMNAVGNYLSEYRASRVAIYLPNSIQLLIAFFATVFHGLTPVLIPQGQSLDTLIEIFHKTNAVVLVTQAGILPPEKLANSLPELRQVVFVVEQASRHMDWTHNTSSTSSKPKVGIWHDIVKREDEGTSSSPSLDLPEKELGNVITVRQNEARGAMEVNEYTQKNVVAAVAAQISALPRNHRISQADLLLPLDSLSLLYPMTVTLAAIFSNASVALTSSTGAIVDLSSAFQGVSPTIVIASSDTLSRLHNDKNAAISGTVQKVRHILDAGTLSSGRMPRARSTMALKGLRLIYVSETIGHSGTPLSSAELFNLRLLTGARIVYSLTSAKVAGAITQTNILDYRQIGASGEQTHFGTPLSSVEVKLVDSSFHKISDDAEPAGNIVVKGPAVAGGEVNLKVLGKIREDKTLAYA